MNKVIIFLIFCIIVTPISALAQEAEEVNSAELEHLKQIIMQKDEEIKILLMALKNGEEEKHAVLSSQNLDFKKVQVLTPTKVVLTPDGLSEEGIKEIDKESQIYKAFVPKQEEVLVKKEAPVAQRLFQDKAAEPVETAVAVEAEDEPEPMVEPEPVVEEEVASEPKLSPLVADEPEEMVVVEKAAPPKYDRRVVVKNTDELTYMQPSKYKVMMLAPVYKNLDGDIYEEWDVDKTFTSNRRRGKWIMITGLITDKGWVKSPTTLWIPESFVKKVR